MNKSLEQLIHDANKNPYLLYSNQKLVSNITKKANAANLNTLKTIINGRTGTLNSLKSFLKQVYIQRYIKNKGSTFANRQDIYNRGDKDIQNYLRMGIRLELQDKFAAEASRIKLKPPMTLVVRNIKIENGETFPNVTLEIYQDKTLVARLECQFDAPWYLILEKGETFNLQRKGWGLFIRALAVYIAKKTGSIKRATQISTNPKRIVTTNGRPPVASLMNKLGFNTNTGKNIKQPNLEFRKFNMTNMSKIKSIVKNRIEH
jgi:hypothetical protein